MTRNWGNKLNTHAARLVALGAMEFNSCSEYLKSDHWLDLRRRFLASNLVFRDESYRLVCQCCLRADKPIHVHHKTYKRLGHERLHDLAVLCGDCHEAAHEYHRKHRAKGLWSATKRARTVGLDIHEKGRRIVRIRELKRLKTSS